MMRPRLCAYEVTRRYISDNANLLPPRLYNRVFGLVRARRFKELAGLADGIDYAKHNIDTVRILRQVSAFFKKNADFAEEEFCRDAAVLSFERGETLCRIANKRLDYYFTHEDRLDPRLREYVFRAQAYIRRTLGSYQSFADSIPDLLRVTSGASALTPRSRSLPFQKLVRKVACTPQCAPLLRATANHLGYRRLGVKITAWNRLEFVPKSWKTHRTIACEPAGNVPFQLAFDTWCKRRLLPRGIDLRNQENNQRQAELGSRYGGNATVDLSMASDTLCYNTVAWLLPSEWFGYLNRVRSPLFRDGAVIRKYAKFSSMGNGATFALETLIFASMLYAVGSRTGIAYGDDLTIEPHLYPELCRLLKFFGFVPNLEKSFVSGPFRESCGKDYFQGEEVTAFYLRRTDPWDKPYACHNVNGLAKLSEHGSLWEYLVSFSKDAGLPFVPENDDTLSGVFIHPHHAYGLRLIDHRHAKNMWVPRVRSLLLKSKTVRCEDSRALALWFLHRKGGDVDPVAGETGHESSRYSRSALKFKVGWTNWQPPVLGFSEHLFGWSEVVTRR